MLQDLHDLLSGIYDLPLEHDVSDYLLTDRDQLPQAVRETGTDEQVLVLQDEDTLWMSLYLEPAVLERLESANPLEALHGGNLSDYWTALEGISHFVCIAWHAAHGKPVTLMELELQGEIDKYVSTLWLLREQDPKRFPAELHWLLFENSRVDPDLAGDRVGLYQQANAYAARYCRRLSRTLRRTEPCARAAAMSELRRFYRLNRHRKVDHIERHA